MKIFTRFLLLGLLVLGVPATTFAASNEVLLVFTANTELNRHLYTLLGSILANNGFKATATLQPGSVTPGKYKAVLVFSTRVTSGLEPTLETFVKGYGAPSEVFLISLLSRSSDLTVTPLSKAATPNGVDGLAAATQWSSQSRAMHNQWVQALLQYLKSK